MSGSLTTTLAPVLGTYDVAELVGIVHNLKLPTTFLIDTFFPNIVESEAPEIAIDVDNGKRRLAPFCSPLVEGKLVESRQWQTNLFRPAYIKDKRVPDLVRPVRRALGERLLGAMTPQERLEANLAFEIEDQIQMIQRRLEWMAASALMTGTVTVSGEGYPTTLVNFQRDPALTVALTGAAQWGQPGISPVAWIDQWATTVLQKSGAVVRDIIFTTTPWLAFTSDLRVFNALLAQKASGAAVELGSRVPHGAQAMGQWGQFRLWLYNEWFVDPVTDVEQPMLPDGTVILASDEMQGVRGFGCIIDPKFNYGALAYAPKMWVVEDPPSINLMMQSAPLVIPSRVNAAMCATVMTAGAAVPEPAF